MNHKDETMNDLGLKKSFIEKRQEERFRVPDDCREYISLGVKSGDRLIPSVLGNFSRNGILFETSVPFQPGARAECVMSVSLLVARGISFIVRVKYCCKNDNSYIIGAAIDSINDQIWFDVFVEIHDFIAVNKRA